MLLLCGLLVHIIHNSLVPRNSERHLGTRLLTIIFLLYIGGSVNGMLISYKDNAKSNNFY